MFGLGKDKDSTEFVFDIEKEVEDPQKRRDLNNLIQERIQKIKSALRSGQDEGEFEKLGTLLRGYTSLVKVIARIKPKELS